MSKFGVREICNVVLKDINTRRPVMFMESLKVSTLENAAESVFATGGRGNSRLMGWDSDKEVTFQVEDALISPEALAMIAGETVTTGVRPAHIKEVLVVQSANRITLSRTPLGAPHLRLFYATVDGTEMGVEYTPTVITGMNVDLPVAATVGSRVIASYYYNTGATTQTIRIRSDRFPGYFILEADTLWRRERDGVDIPALFTMPKVKIQSDFSITMESSGDPSVFSFNMDVFKDPNSTDMVIIDILE